MAREKCAIGQDILHSLSVLLESLPPQTLATGHSGSAFESDGAERGHTGAQEGKGGGAGRKAGWEPNDAMVMRYREELIDAGLSFGEGDMQGGGLATCRHSFWREISLSTSSTQKSGKMKRIAEELRAFAQGGDGGEGQEGARGKGGGGALPSSPAAAIFVRVGTYGVDLRSCVWRRRRRWRWLREADVPVCEIRGSEESSM